MGSAALVMVMRWARRLRSVLRRWYRINARRLVRPDEHHRARSMVDDESSGMAQAPGSEVRAIAISGDDEDIHTLGNCAHHFLLDAPRRSSRSASGRPQAIRGGREQLGGLIIGDVLVSPVWLSRRKAAPEQSECGRIGGLGHIRWRHMQEGELGVGGKALDGRVDAPLPRALNNPDNDMHGGH